MLALKIDRTLIEKTLNEQTWLALVIGNTRLHWGLFHQQDLLAGAWHTPHLSPERSRVIAQANFTAPAWQAIPTLKAHPQKIQHAFSTVATPPSQLWIASAVPAQTSCWVTASHNNAQITTHTVERSQIPLAGLYPTLGIDRAINLLGAGSQLNWPVLVIDSGTALTFTAGISREGVGTVYGGAILPGLRLQAQSLGQGTAALAEAAELGTTALTATSSDSTEPSIAFPERWANDTPGAITSGLAYGTTAILWDYLTDWWANFPNGNVIMTGGDGRRLYDLLRQKAQRSQTNPFSKAKTAQETAQKTRTPEKNSRVHTKIQDIQVDNDLMFWGMRAYRNELILES